MTGAGPDVDHAVDVVVVSYNSLDHLPGLLSSLPGACDGVTHRVVVVDNGSVDGTREWLRSQDGVTLVEGPNVGFGAGVNAGVRCLGGAGPVLVLNPDVRLEPGSVSTMVRVLMRRRAAVVVPLLLGPDGSRARSLRREPTVWRTLGLGDSRFPLLSEVVREDRAYDTEHEAEWATGAVMLLDRATFEHLGGFDEWFFMYSEETDYCLRARECDRPTVFTPYAVALHVGGGSGRSPDLYALQVLNRIRLHRRRHSLLATVLLVVLTLGREGWHASRGSAESRRALRALRGDRPAQVPWTGSMLRRSDPASLYSDI